MRLFISDDPDTVENNIQYYSIGRSFYRCLKEWNLASLQNDVHDEAVMLLEQIFRLLNDSDLDDTHCMDEIVLLYMRHLDLHCARHQERIYQLMQGKTPDLTAENGSH